MGRQRTRLLHTAESRCQEGEARVAAAYKREQAGISVAPYTSIAAAANLGEYRAWQTRAAESSELLFRGSEALGLLVKNAAGERIRDDDAMRVSRSRQASPGIYLCPLDEMSARGHLCLYWQHADNREFDGSIVTKW